MKIQQSRLSSRWSNPVSAEEYKLAGTESQCSFLELHFATHNKQSYPNSGSIQIRMLKDLQPRKCLTGTIVIFNNLGAFVQWPTFQKLPQIVIKMHKYYNFKFLRWQSASIYLNRNISQSMMKLLQKHICVVLIGQAITQTSTEPSKNQVTETKT